jgi:hypothetical protein
MANAAFSATATILDDGYFAVVATQTGPDTMSLDIKEWPVGADPTTPPKTEKTYDCVDVRVNGNRLTCTSTPALLDPEIEIVLSPSTNLPSATIKVSSNFWWIDSTKVLPLSAADYAAAEKFLTDAAFPIG